MPFTEGRNGGDLRDFRNIDAIRQVLRDIGELRNEFQQSLEVSDQGALAGMVVGVKPALEIEGQGVDTARLVEGLKRAGVEAIEKGRLIVEIKAVEERIRHERMLALEVGWDPKAPIDEFIKQNHLENKPRGNEPVEWHSKRGFLFGYPESAINSTIQAWQIVRQKGVPLFFDYSHGNPTTQSQQSYRRDYENVLTSEELDFLLSEDRHMIFSPSGQMVYQYRVYGRDPRIEADYNNLQAKVNEAFAAIEPK